MKYKELRTLLKEARSQIVVLNKKIDRLEKTIASKNSSIPCKKETSFGSETLYIDGKLKYSRPIKNVTLKEFSDSISPHFPQNTLTDEPAEFSSRFMPNVKFKIVGHTKELESIHFFSIAYAQFAKFIGGDGDTTASSGNWDIYYSWEEKEVSIYEAIPELVPDCMFYDKSSGFLLRKSSGSLFQKSTKSFNSFFSLHYKSSLIYDNLARFILCCPDSSLLSYSHLESTVSCEFRQNPSQYLHHVTIHVFNPVYSEPDFFSVFRYHLRSRVELYRYLSDFSCSFNHYYPSQLSFKSYSVCRHRSPDSITIKILFKSSS